jgi:hypothetical protein
MTLLERFSVQASGQTTPDERLLDDNAEPLVLRLHGRKLAEIVAVGHPPESLIYPYRPDSGQHGDMPTVFHRMLDPCGYSGVWARPATGKDEECNDEAQWCSVYSNHVEAHVDYFPEPYPPTVQPTDGGPLSSTRQTSFPPVLGGVSLLPPTACAGSALGLQGKGTSSLC